MSADATLPGNPIEVAPLAVDERSRHELHQKLDRVLGPDEATTLMSLLPPVGWADVATTRDLDALAADLRAEISGLRAELHEELGGLRAEFHRELSAATRTLMLGMITSVVAVGSLAFGAARLL